MTTSAPGLWHDDAFRRFLAARVVAGAGFAITSVALPLLVFQLTGSTFLTAALAAVEVLPYLAFGLVAGAVADRADRRRLMLTCQGVAGTALLSVPVAAATGVLTVGHVFVAAAMLHSAYVWFDAASFGALPALVGRDRLPAANSILYTGSAVVDVSFPAVGGVLIAAVGPAAALGADALSYAAAAAIITTIRTPLQLAREAPTPAGGRARRTRADISEGLQFLWRQPVVRALSLLGFGQSTAAGTVTSLLVVFAIQDLHLDDDSGLTATVFIAVATGGLIGGGCLPLITRYVPTGWITILALTVNAVVLAAITVIHTVPVVLALLVLWSASSTTVILNGITTRQRLIPDTLQSRVNTTARMIAWGGAPVGALAGGALAAATDVRTAYLAAAATVGVTAVAALISPLRHRSLVGDSG